MSEDFTDRDLLVAAHQALGYAADVALKNGDKKVTRDYLALDRAMAERGYFPTRIATR